MIIGFACALNGIVFALYHSSDIASLSFAASCAILTILLCIIQHYINKVTLKSIHEKVSTITAETRERKLENKKMEIILRDSETELEKKKAILKEAELEFEKKKAELRERELKLEKLELEDINLQLGFEKRKLQLKRGLIIKH